MAVEWNESAPWIRGNANRLEIWREREREKKG